MNLLERVLTLLRANLSVVVENAEDPEKALKQLHLDMRNQLVQVKTQVATAIAEGMKLQKRQQECEKDAQAWLQKAKQAVQQGNDASARDALSHYNDLTRQAAHFQQLKQDQDRLVSVLREALRQLEIKITEVRTNLEVLETRKRNALIQQRVLDALNKPTELDTTIADIPSDAGNHFPTPTTNTADSQTNGSKPYTLREAPSQARRRGTDQLGSNPSTRSIRQSLPASGDLNLEELKKLLNID